MYRMRVKKLKIEHRRKHIRNKTEEENPQGRWKSNDREVGRKPGECSVKEASWRAYLKERVVRSRKYPLN